MEKLNLRQLHKLRSTQYWRRIFSYLRFLGGSIPGILLIAGFCLFGYGYFVNHLPDQFPIYVLMAVLLTIPVNAGNLRTYLREADIVFLLPVESQMAAYLKPCLRAAFITHVFIITMIWFILWPLYQASHEQPLFALYALIWLQMVLMQGIVMYGVWHENQIRESRTRQIYVWIRPLLIGLIIYVVLTQTVAVSLIVIGVTSIAYVLALRAVPSYSIHWERLIVLEHRSKSRWITFLNLFIEVQREHSSVRQTRWLHRIARIVTFKNTNAYRYLYILTWIRSELFYVVIRLTLLGVVLIVILDSIWIKLGLLILFVYITRLQLSELARYHKNVEVSSVYPVKKDQRADSARYIAVRIHLIVVIVLVVAALI